ncbi:6790_t:CDS:2, partial [Cetraspora pellucida]
MTQSFLSMPNFSKTYLYVIPKNLYQEFCNAFAFFTMVKACNPSMNRQDLMDTANTEWRLCRTESETTIRDQIKQYLAASPPIIRTANFFLPPGSYSSKSSNSLNTNSNSAISSLPSANEEHILAPNASSQRQALTLIKETGTKVNEYENLLLNTNDIDLRRQIYEKLRDNRAIIEKEKKRSHLNSQGVVVDEDLAKRNFEFSGQSLCEIWKRDNIHGRQMITKHKQVIHAKKPLQKNENQTSISDLELPIVLIEHVELPYLSTEEVIESLEYLDNDNHQIQLSNSTFMEDFSNLPSIRSSCQSSEVFDLRE